MLIGGRVITGESADVLWLEREDVFGDQAFALDRGRLRPSDLSLLHLTLENLPPYRHGRSSMGSDGAAAVDGRDDTPQGVLLPVALPETGEVLRRWLQCRCCRAISYAAHPVA